MSRKWKMGVAVLVMGTAVWGNVLGVALAKQEPVPLHPNLGDHHYRISTDDPMTQRYFDQGLVLAYGFNHAEAARSFREGARLDPTCAMCYWGEALVLGPNINAPMDPTAVPLAVTAVQRALSLLDHVTEKERALIHAVAARYSPEASADRKALDETYAEAMRKVFAQFPQDPVIGALLAEALMDLHPWNFWTRKGEPRPWTPEIVKVLETVLDMNANNPLANHLYIHVMEASPHPEKAIPSADRLPALVPGSGHLVHMPGHIYIRVGRYRDAVMANQAAVEVDQNYLNHSHVESIYTLGYVPHNYHFLWAAAVKSGQRELALHAAKKTRERVDPETMRSPGFSGTLQHFWSIPLYTQAVFGLWAELLNTPAPPADLRYPTGVWHYARGLAFARQGQMAQAETELAALRALLQDPQVAALKIFDLNAVAGVLEVGAAILSGEIAAAKGDVGSAIEQVEQAVTLEASLNYTEPRDWYLPPRQVLGALLLEAGRPAQAETVYRADLQEHPQNGWSLFGLLTSLRRQGKALEAEAAQREFVQAWGDADITLTSSRF